jgi:hypothetical protein
MHLAFCHTADIFASIAINASACACSDNDDDDDEEDDKNKMIKLGKNDSNNK